MDLFLQYTRVNLMYLRLFGVVSNTHSDVLVAAPTPDVVRHLKPNDKDATVHLSGPLPKRMHPMVAV